MRIISNQDGFCSEINSSPFWNQGGHSEGSFPQGGCAVECPMACGRLFLPSLFPPAVILHYSLAAPTPGGTLSLGMDTQARTAGSKFLICSSLVRSPALNPARGTPYSPAKPPTLVVTFSEY